MLSLVTLTLVSAWAASINLTVICKLEFLFSPFSMCQVIQELLYTGWDQGILGMCVGEKRKLKIPAKLGYGAQGSPPKIPGNFD